MKDLLSIDFFHPKSKLGYLQRHFYNFLSTLQRVSSEKQHFELKANKASNSKSHPKKKTHFQAYLALPGTLHTVGSNAEQLTALTSVYGGKAELTERTQRGGPAVATGLVGSPPEPSEQLLATYKLSLCLNFCSWR
jgi:hypothetical protein